MIEGISHMTFIVADLDKASLFFEEIFNAKQVYDSGNQTYSLSKERFFLIGDLWIAIMEGESLTETTYNHIAFKIPKETLPLYLEKINSLGLTIKEQRSRVKEEGESLYFYDFDHHLFELHTGTLAERLTRYERDQNN
ncbi:FosX/FosE/FosI family fosfomycin resistance hydrolase [Vagococcus allomyrinae]|uniref:FosX/FosE/FosI family fosfomycin resistance hydrolase n=1 Tax=Vagococcus allomyrinae TaxID=2794353 RepID=UPI001AE30C33|nr:FosX/FosE/FosI family fosfomycin resistance hydrolase [Vagococcus allomyrinae]